MKKHLHTNSATITKKLMAPSTTNVVILGRIIPVSDNQKVTNSTQHEQAELCLQMLLESIVRQNGDSPFKAANNVKVIYFFQLELNQSRTLVFG